MASATFVVKMLWEREVISERRWVETINALVGAQLAIATNIAAPI